MNALRILAMLLTASLFSCSEDEPVLLSGDVTGRIGYYEANYYNFVDSLGGVEVTLRNQNGTEHVLTTSDNGRYSFKGVEAGLYTLEFDKTNAAGPFVDYSRESRKSLTHLGGGVTIASDYLLLERPTYPVNDLSYQWDNNMITITASLGMVEGDRFNFLIFFGNESVSSQTHVYEFDTAHSSELTVAENASGEKTVEIQVQLPEPQEYVVVYPYSVWGTEALGLPSEVLYIPQ